MEKDIQYSVVSSLLSSLCTMCAGGKDKTIDLLTGYLWDEEEAGDIKRAPIDYWEDKISKIGPEQP